jgi:hypothetical protein
MAERRTGRTAIPITTRRQYRTSSGLLRVQLGQCKCGAEVIRPLSEMLTEHVLLDAEPATEGRLLTLLLVGGREPVAGWPAGSSDPMRPMTDSPKWTSSGSTRVLRPQRAP